MQQEIRQGSVEAITTILAQSESFTPASATITVYDSADAVVLNNVAAAVAATSQGNEWEVFYVWDTSAISSGFYRAHFKVVIGSWNKFLEPVYIHVLPASSKLHPYYREVLSILREHDSPDPPSFTEVQSAIDRALPVYSMDHPRRVRTSLALTPNDWTYPLSSLAGWTGGFSDILALEPDVDATIQTRYFLRSTDYRIDLEAGEVQFLYIQPATGDTAYFTVRALQRLDHTTDDIPSRHFKPFCLYVAGEVMQTLAAEAVQTAQPQLASGMVSFDLKYDRYTSLGPELKREGRRQWIVTDAWRDKLYF